MSAIPNRRQPAFKNGVKKQKLHNKSILNLEEIFKTGPKMPQQMSRTSPTTPWSWVWQQFGFLSQVFIPSLKMSGISQGFQLDKGVRAAALQGGVLLLCSCPARFPAARAFPGTSKQTLLALGAGGSLSVTGSRAASSPGEGSRGKELPRLALVG